MNKNSTSDVIEGLVRSLSKDPDYSNTIVCPSCGTRKKAEEYEIIPTQGISGFITFRCRECSVEFVPSDSSKPSSLKKIDLDKLERKRVRRKRHGPDSSSQ